MSDDARVTLHALIGTPLKDEAIRDLVVATAHAIAERQGVEVLDVQSTDDAVTVRIRGSTIEAMGLAAELRRTTDRWHEGKYGVPLWGPSPTPS